MKVQFRLVFILSVILALLSAGLPIQWARSNGQGIQGTPGMEQLRAVEDMAAVEARDAQQPGLPQSNIPPFMIVPEDPGAIQESPANPLPVEAPAALLVDSPPAASSFLALEDNNTSIPPDTHGSAGPNHLMVTLNTQVRIQDRSGATLSTVGLNTFWSSVNGGSGTFDPKVLYDPYNGRWITVACDDSWSTSSGFLIGVTASNDPTGAWYKFRIAAADTNWIDYPSIGFNKNWIVVNFNIFSSGGSYIRSEVYAFNKATLYTGASAPYTRFTHTNGTYAPATTYDNSLNTEYLIRTHDSTAGILRLATITGAVGAETFTESVTNLTSSLGGWAQYSAGNNDFAPQLGSAQKIMNNDHRMQNLVYRNGSLWATHTIFLPSGGSPTRSAVQWWQISTTPSIIQNGRIDDNSGATFYAFPSIAVNANNDVLVGFSRYSASQYASGNYAFRASTDAANTMRTDVVLKAGEAKYYKTYSGTKNRWGDYSYTMVDPLNDIDFWTIQEYAWTPGGGYDRWSTWWGRIIPPPLAFNKTSPSNGATGVAINPTLFWGASSGATSYEYCIDTSNDNACTLPATWTSTAASTNVLPGTLSYNTTYYWHVRANNTGGTTYANTDTWWSFTTVAAPSPPGAFNKTSPANGAGGVAINPTLSWGTSSGAASYEYCIDTNGGDNACTAPAVWTSTGANTSVPLGSLSNNTTYYWHVRAHNISGDTYSNSNTWWSFTTIAAPPAAFGKSTPTNGGTGVSTSPTLQWNASAGAASYEYCIDISADNACTSPVVWTSTGANTSIALSGLGGSATYYWQVRASSAGGTTYANSSAWWSFTTQAGPPAAFSKTTPANTAIVLTTGPTLSWQASAGATSYEYCIDNNPDNLCTFPAVWTNAFANTSVILSNLTKGATYYWHVRANNGSGAANSNSDAWWGFTVTTNYLFLPALYVNNGSLNLFNGDFELGRNVGWSESSTGGFQVVMNAADLPQTPHGGSWAAWLGGANSETTVLSQTVSVPSQNHFISFWYWIDSGDVCGWDYGYVRINSVPVQTWNLCTTNNTGGWARGSVDLSAYSGQIVALEFRVTTDISSVSNLFLDDVVFTSSAYPPKTNPAPTSASDAVPEMPVAAPARKE